MRGPLCRAPETENRTEGPARNVRSRRITRPRPVAWLVLLTATAACGGGETDPRALALADSYEAVVVSRVRPDGLLPDRLEVTRVTFLTDSTGSVVPVMSEHGSGTATGRYEPETARLVLEPFDATLTSSVAERVVEFGGTVSDGIPSNLVGDELSGFFRSQRGRDVLEGRMVGASVFEGRPEAPVASSIAATNAQVGVVRLVGEAGAVGNNAGLEFFRFTLGQTEPTYTVFAADADGAFDTTIDGLVDDVILIRTLASAVASPLVAIVVTRD